MPAYPPPGQIELPNEWFDNEGDFDEKPLIVRLRRDVLPLAGHPDYPVRFDVLWTFGGQNEGGYPSPHDEEAMDAMEKRLRAAVEEGQQAIITAVITYEGNRRWLIYSSNQRETQRRIIQALADQDKHIVNFSFNDDPQWQDYVAVAHGAGT